MLGPLRPALSCAPSANSGMPGARGAQRGAQPPLASMLPGRLAPVRSLRGLALRGARVLPATEPPARQQGIGQACAARATARKQLAAAWSGTREGLPAQRSLGLWSFPKDAPAALYAAPTSRSPRS
jgi:hypothetical protein